MNYSKIIRLREERKETVKMIGSCEFKKDEIKYSDTKLWEHC
jgi:hypothetical protein